MSCMVRIRSRLRLALFTDWSVLTKSSVQTESTPRVFNGIGKQLFNYVEYRYVHWQVLSRVKSSQVKGGVQVSIGKSNNEGHYKV